MTKRKDEVREDQRREGLKMASAEGEVVANTTPDRVENYLDEKAVEAWTKDRRWANKVMIVVLMGWLKKLDHKATVEEVDAFVESQKGKGPVNYGFMGVKSYLDEDALAAWETGKWRGVNVEALVEKLLKGLGRKATVSDVDAFVEEGERRKSEMRDLYDARIDSDAKEPVICECPEHRGPNAPFRAEMEYATYFDKALGKRVRKTYVDSKKEVRAGQFLIVGEKLVAYCKNCKRAANDRREEKRSAAYQQGVRGGDLPRRLVWMTYASATETLANIKTGQTARDEAEALENESLDNTLTRNYKSHMQGRGGRGRSRGNDFRRRV